MSKNDIQKNSLINEKAKIIERLKAAANLRTKKLYFIVLTVNKRKNLSQGEKQEWFDSFAGSRDLLLSIFEKGKNNSPHQNLILALNPKQVFPILNQAKKEKSKGLGLYLKKVENLDRLAKYLLKELTNKNRFLTRVCFGQAKQQKLYLQGVRGIIRSY